jgi:long-chain acyl-CoA synthetase
MLDDAARQCPEGIALICGNEQLTYRQYAACVAGMAEQLRQADLGVGERVVLFMSNSVDIAIATYAVQAAGAQVVPLNPAYTASELNQVLDNAAARGIVYDESAHAVVSGALHRFDASYRIGDAEGSQRLHRWKAQPEYADKLLLPDPESLSTLQYTGGTTGVPKGVSLSHRAVAINVSQREALVPTRPEAERVLAITPLFHVYAVSMGLYLAAYCRGTLVIVARYKPDIVLDSIAHYDITLMLGSPTIFMGLMGYEGFAQADLTSLRLCSSGSSALAEDTLRRWEAATGCTVCEGYGQTEAGPVLAYNPFSGVRKLGSVGLAVPQTEIQVVDVHDGDKVLALGEVGEIRARGPQIMSEYFRRPVETAEALRDGWLYTGDIGYLDAEGYLTICDRKKELVIVSGFNVYPREIEEVLFRHPNVSEAAVVGVPDDYRGEVLVAYVVADGAPVADDDLMNYLAKHLVKYKWPAQIVWVDQLPKTPVGKVDKKRIREMAAQVPGYDS